MIKKSFKVFVFLLLICFCSPLYAQMSDDVVIEYVEKSIKKGKSQA